MLPAVAVFEGSEGTTIAISYYLLENPRRENNSKKTTIIDIFLLRKNRFLL